MKTALPTPTALSEKAAAVYASASESPLTRLSDRCAVAVALQGAGVWDHFPSIVIKGVCDYADSHKNKQWQRFDEAIGGSKSEITVFVGT